MTDDDFNAREDARMEEVFRREYPGLARIVPRLSGACHECGEAFRPGDPRAEVYLDRSHVLRGAAGDGVMLDDAPDSAFGPFLVHQEPCYLQNEDKYQLA